MRVGDFGRIGMRGLGSPLLAWTEDGRASVGLGSARKDSSAIAIGEEGCAGRCWISGVRLLCDAFAHALAVSVCGGGKVQLWNQNCNSHT